MTMGKITIVPAADRYSAPVPFAHRIWNRTWPQAYGWSRPGSHYYFDIFLRIWARRASQHGSLGMDDFQSAAKAKQASKLLEIREALIEAGCNSTAKQAAAMGVCRSTAWAVLNGDKRVGPSASIIKRILSSPKLPPVARRKIEEFVEERVSGLYGHSAWSHDQFLRASTQPTSRLKQNQVHAAGP